MSDRSTVADSDTHGVSDDGGTTLERRLWWTGALLALLGLVEAGAAVIGPRVGPTLDDWQAAARPLHAEFRPGDLIVAAPAWADPLARQVAGDLLTVEQAARPDADRFGRIWQLRIGAARAPEVESLSVNSSRCFGRVCLDLFEKPHDEVLFDLVSRFAEARVTSVDAAGAELTCQSDPSALAPGTLRCLGGQVSPRVAEVDYLPRRALVVQPDAGRTTHLAWRALPGGRLVGSLGMHDFNQRKYVDGPVDVVLTIDGKEAQRTRYTQDAGWRRFELPLSPGAHDLDLAVSAPSVDRRSLALFAEVRK
jgi:hypothetical protein